MQCSLRNAGDIQLLVDEGQPQWLLFFDDGHLYAANLGQGLAIEHQLAKIRVGFQYDLATGFPFFQRVGPGAHRLGIGVAGVGFDGFTRYGAESRHGQNLQKVVVALGQRELQRVFVQRLDALYRGVVVQCAFAGSLDQRVCADKAAIHQKAPRRIDGGVQVALDGIGVVCSGQLALLAFEHRVCRKIDTRLELEGVHAAICRHGRQGNGGIGNHLGRAGQVVIAYQRVEHVFDDGAGVRVRYLGRVEAGFRYVKGHAQHLVHVCRLGGHGEEGGDSRHEHAFLHH